MYLYGIGYFSIFLMSMFAVILLFTRMRNNSGDGFADIEFPDNLWMILGIIFLVVNIFGYQGKWGLGSALALIAVLVTAYLAVYKTSFQESRKLTLLGVVFGFLIMGRANGFIQTVNAITVVVVLGILLLVRAQKNLEFTNGGFINSCYNYCQAVFANLLILPAFLIKKKDGGISVLSVFKIIGLTFILVVGFSAILSIADPVFSQLVSNFMGQLIGRTFLTVLAIIVVLLLFTVKLSKETTRTNIFAWVTPLETIIPTLAVAILFAVFIVVQIKYLFSSSTDLSRFGYSYSEYVRRGFVELLIATAIGGVLSYVVYVKEKVVQLSWLRKLITVTNLILLVELVLLLISAGKRDLLYIDTYGFTRTRVIGGIVLLWLMGFLALLFGMAIFRKWYQEKLFFIGLGILSLVVVFVLNVFNVDRFIAQQNPPTTNDQQPEYYYVASLSEDAIDAWLNLIPKIRTQIEPILTQQQPSESQVRLIANSKVAVIQLREKWIRLEKKYGDYAEATQLLADQSDYNIESLGRLRDWRGFNLSEWNAYQKMKASKELFSRELDCLLSDIIYYQNRYHVDTYSEELNTLTIQRPFLNYKTSYFPGDLTNELDVTSFIPALHCSR